MRILLAADDSPHSAVAIDEVRRRPWPAGTQVRVFSVVPPPRPAATELWFIGAADLDAAEAELASRIGNFAARTAENLRTAGIEADHVVKHGDPRTEIVDHAAEWKADLIMLGSHGYTGLTRLLLGSVAQFVVSHAVCSVEIVRRREEEGSA